MDFDLWVHRGLKIIGFGKAPSKDGAFFCPCSAFLFFPSPISSVHLLLRCATLLALHILMWIIPLHTVR
jgi:hypothetical protein